MTEEEVKNIKFYSNGCINYIHWGCCREYCKKHKEFNCWYYLCCEDHDMKED